MSVFNEWTCIFPGKMGLSWKQSWGTGTKEEAEVQADKNCNVIAVPLQLFETMKDHERRMVAAERELQEIKAGKPPCKHEKATFWGDSSLVGSYRCDNCKAMIDPVEYHKTHNLPHVQLSDEHNQRAWAALRGEVQ